MDKELVERYLRGACTETEKQSVEEWLRKGDELPPATQADNGTKDRHWQQLEDRIREKHTKRPIIHRLTWALSSVAVLFLVALGIFLFRSASAPEPAEWVQVDNPLGKRSTLTLPDGTVIQLAGGSRIAYPKRFVDTLREVRFLRGEAYFTVHRDIHRPFIVHTGKTEYIRVLGTEFNVRHADGYHPLQITLIQGSVAYHAAAQHCRLVPGEQLTSSEGDLSKHQLADTDPVFAWTTGTLWFAETPLQEVFSRLEQHYGVMFSGTGTVEHQLITGKFTREPLDHILRVISQSTDIAFARKGKHIIISKK